MRRVARPAATRLVLGAGPKALDGRVMAEWVPAIWDVLATIERRDWARLRHLLDPDVHWTTAIEEQLHGSSAVIACLSVISHLGLRPTNPGSLT